MVTAIARLIAAIDLFWGRPWGLGLNVKHVNLDSNLKNHEKVNLLRGGTPIRSLLGAFGSSLKETRLTAMLGYLIAQNPSPWQKYFALKDSINEVSVELSRDEGRADIWLLSGNKTIVIEVKVTHTDPSEQSRKYKADKSILIATYHPTAHKSARHQQYYNWDSITQFLASDIFLRKQHPMLKYLAKETINYMKESGLIRESEADRDIYAREINNEMTMKLFLKARLYGCLYEKGGAYADANYFAPHFGQRLAKEHPGIFTGISYVARIEAIEVVDTWKELKAAVVRHRGKPWLNSHADIIDPIHRDKEWNWNGVKRSFLFLAPPRLVFNPPVNKDLLQKGKGWLSKRSFSFDTLFEAWSRAGSAKFKK